WIGRSVGPDAEAIFFGEADALDDDILVQPPVAIVEHRAACRAEIALNVEAVLFFDLRPQLVWHEVQRLLVHRAATIGVHRALIRSAVALEATLEQRDNGRLATANRSHEQENPLADLEPPGGRGEIVD